jgi:regulator of cell morphogenesis and NO signaling
MITRNHIINDIIRQYPETISIFNQFRVDACCGGGRPIAETAAADGIHDLTELLHALNRKARKLEDKTLREVTELIEQTHHVYLKKELPELLGKLRVLEEETKEPPLAEIIGELSRELSGLGREIEEHLFKEEQILFPSIRNLEAALQDNELDEDFMSGCGIQGPVAQMNFEHEQARHHLEAIYNALKSLEDHNIEKESALGELGQRIEILRDDLLEHIRAEEEDLFPRALELENQFIQRHFRD